MRALHLFFFLFTSAAHAQYGVPSDDSVKIVQSVVKVESSLINGQATLRGSGFLFSANNGAYVITSDHVVFQNNDRARHRVFFSEGKTAIPCTFVRATYAKGLALLKCDYADVAWLLPFRDAGYSQTFGTATPGGYRIEKEQDYFESQTIYQVEMAGYPIASSTLAIHGNGNSIISYSKWHPILMDVTVNHAVEDSFAELGMSGGILFSRRDFTGENPYFYGILTHLRATEGSPRVYAVPIQDVAWFIIESLRGDGLEYVRQEVHNQLRNPMDVRIGNYNLEYHPENVPGLDQASFRVRAVAAPARVASPTGPMGRPASFEKKLDRYFAEHPLCTAYLLGVHETVPENQYRWKVIENRLTNVIRVLRALVHDQDDGIWQFQCPAASTASPS